MNWQKTGSLTDSCLFHLTRSLKTQSFSFVLHKLMTKTIHPPGPWSGCIFIITTVFSVSNPTIKWSETKARSNGLSLSLPSLPSFLLLLWSLFTSSCGRSGFLLSWRHRVARDAAGSWAGSRGSGRTAGSFTGITGKQNKILMLLLVH